MATQGTVVVWLHRYRISGDACTVVSRLSIEERAKRDIVCAASASMAEMSRRFAGDADNCVRTELCARILIAGVVLADMNTVAARLACEVGPVVHNKCDIPFLCRRPQAISGASYDVVVDIFQTELNAISPARIQRGFQLLGECQWIIQARRRYQIDCGACVFARSGANWCVGSGRPVNVDDGI